MQFNQYSLYTYQTEEFKDATNEKILVDLQRLKSIKDYDDVVDYVQKVIGSIDNEENYFEFYQKEVINNIISKYGDIADIWRAFRERKYIEVNKGTNSFSKTSRCMVSNKTKKFFRINVVDTSVGDIIEF